MAADGFRPISWLAESFSRRVHISSRDQIRAAVRDCRGRMRAAAGWSWRLPHPAIVLPAAAVRTKAHQKRTKYRQIYRYFRLLTQSNLFRTFGRWECGDRVKMALYL
jgi:hypothetical protein